MSIPLSAVPTPRSSFGFVLAAWLLGSLSASAGTLVPENLRSEYLVNPLGIDAAKPRLSWELRAADPRLRSLRQSSYQILVASSPELLMEGRADLWDSGRVASNETVGVEYAGKPLGSRERCHWKVRVFDQDGQPSGWSEPAFWSMGLLESSDWKARWIADRGPAPAPLPPHLGYRSRPAATADQEKWIQLDMGVPTRIDGLRLIGTRLFGSVGGDVPGYLFPVRFRLDVATRANFRDQRTVLDQTGADVLNPGVQPLDFRFPATTARYARLVVTRMRSDGKGAFGLALAELELLEGMVCRSRGASATASDSMESNEWSVRKLTDGDIFWHPGGDVAPMAPPLMRREFHLRSGLRYATAYASALGVYEMRINGRRVGDHILAPEWTDYRHIVQYQAFDVTKMLQAGRNAIGVFLGDGWYAGRIGMTQTYGPKRLRGVYGRKPQFLLQLYLEFEDGSSEMIATDGSWRSTTLGPIRSADIYDGEVEDRRLEQAGWDQFGFDDGGWAPVALTEPAVTMVAQRNEPIRIGAELPARSVRMASPGVHIFDLGQNMAGWARLRVRGRSGDRIILRHAEALTPDSQLFAALSRGAAQKDEFILRGDPNGEVLEPHFTYHGFRYVEVTGLRQPPRPTDLIGVVFYSSARETGSLETSSALVNRLWQNVLWTQRGNMMGVQTDCPQRDERLGWLGDYQIFVQAGAFNMNLAPFIEKTARDMRLAQYPDGNLPHMAPNVLDFRGGSAYADAGVLVPWAGYVHFADRRLLEELFETGKRWVEWEKAQSKDLILAAEGFPDWLNADTLALRNWPARGASMSREAYGTAYFAHSAHILARMAAALGRAAEAAHYQSLFEAIREVFQKRFIAADGRMSDDNQSAYTVALHFDLMPEALRPAAASFLVQAIQRYGGHPSTGMPLSGLMMLELARTGRSDVAWQLLNQRTPPSWRYMIEQGATTVWERWDSYIAGRTLGDYPRDLAVMQMQAPVWAEFQTTSMNSLNHPAFASIGEWLYRVVLGLAPSEAEPGYREFSVSPKPGGGVTWARGTLKTVRGPIAIEWFKADGNMRFAITVPANTSATVTLPAASLDGVTESGQPLAKAPGVTVFDTAARNLRLQSGHYEFAAFEPAGPASRGLRNNNNRR